MSEYYTPPPVIPPATLARSADVNQISTNTAKAFSKVPAGLGLYVSEIETARGTKATLNERLDAADAATSTVSTEVTNARDGETTLTAKLGAMSIATGNVSTEVATARGGKPSLTAKLTEMSTATSTLSTEVSNARDGKPNLLAKLTDMSSTTSGIGTEVSNARGTQSNLKARLDATDNTVSGQGTEISNARGSSATLSARFTATDASINTVATEVSNARDGEVSLKLRLDGIDQDIVSIGEQAQTGFPIQTGNTGKFLTTNGTAVSWKTVDKTLVGLDKVPNLDATKPINWDLDKTVDNFIISDGTSFKAKTLSGTKTLLGVDYGTTNGTVCQGADTRLSNSRKCNNTFDNASTARDNLGLGSKALGNQTISTSDPSGGSHGDVWYKV